MSLTNTIKSIQKIMRKDAGIDGDAQRIGQLGWMLFLKIYSDLELETELSDSSYKSPTPKGLRWQEWADEDSLGRETLTGDALVNFVNNELFPGLKNLDLSLHVGQARDRGALLVSVFDDTYNYMKNGVLLRQVINKINQDIDYNSVETRHLFGEIYEQILKDLQSAGNAGEYYTPRAVTQFAIDMINPKLGETVLDPACGTGGFLTCAFEHMKQDVKTTEALIQLKNSIKGVEKKQLPHTLCATNMMIHGIEVPSNIINDNTLARPLRDYGKSDQVDVILTNPPFGGVEEDGIENNFPSEFRTRETADLFLVLIVELLKDGGRSAVVLPDGTMFSEGIKTRVKKKLLDECNLHTIIRLPKNVFAPYTDIKTNILFFTKGAPTKEIWFYEHPYPEGAISYNKTKPINISEFDQEKEWWNNRVESELSWKVSIEDVISRNYNLDFENPNKRPDEVKSPTEIIADYRESSSLVNHTKELLHREFSRSLSGKATYSEYLDNFDVIVESSKGLARLREFILDIAVHGYLSNSENTPRNEELDLPKSWSVKSLEDVCEYLQRGKSPKYADKSEALVVSQKCVQWTGFDLSAARPINAISLESYKPERFLIEGDILWNSTGTGTVGRTAIFHPSPEHSKVVADSHVTVVRAPSMNSDFLWSWTASPRIQRRIESLTSGSTNQQELNLATLKTLLVPVPEIHEQEEIVAKLRVMMNLCDLLEAQLKTRNSVADEFSLSATLTHLLQ